MIKNHHLSIITSILFCVLVFLLPISKALTSIVSALLIAYVTYDYFKDGNKKIDRPLCFLFIAYFSISFLSILYSDNLAAGWQKLMVKLPLLFVPLIHRVGAKSKGLWDITFEQIFIWMAVIVASLSTINYYTNKEALDFMVLQNKPIPVMSHIYHIEFSVILALALVLCAYRLLFFYWRNSLYQWLYLAALVLGVYALHIMAVRTGMLCFYMGISSLIVSYILKTKKIWILGLGIVLVAGMFTAGYSFSESFKNRITLTLDDLNVLTSNKDRNWHSVSMRVDASKNAFSIIKKHPLLGVGIGDVDTEVQKSFIANNSQLLIENRKKPHHQFLENAVQSGILSPLILLFILALPFLIKKYRSPLGAAVIIVLFTAMQFESILERQSTVVVFVLLYAYVLKYGNPRPAKA